MEPEPHPHPPPVVAASPAARRRAKQAERLAAARQGVSLGLEDEVQFDIGEDLMEEVGEIPIAPTNTWYPGKPDSPPPPRKGRLHPHSDSHSSAGSSKPRGGLLARKDRQRTKGLDDAKLVLPPSAGETARSSAGSTFTGHSRHGSDHSFSGSSGFTATTGVTSTTSANRLDGLAKEKSKSRVFGKLFGKKKDHGSGSTIGSRSIASDSVESFGSASRFSDTSSQPRSIFITPAHLPPSHIPPSRISSDPASSLASLPTTPHSVASAALASRRGHVSQPSGASDAPLIKEMQSQGISGMSTSQSYDTFNSNDEYIHAKSSSVNGHFDPIPPLAHPAVVRSLTDGSRVEEGQKADPSSASPSVGSASRFDTPSPSTSTESSKPSLPLFPTSEQSLDAITALSATVMRRQRSSHASLDQTASGSNESHAGTPRKPIWQTHQLALTAFRPEPGVSPTAATQSRGSDGHLQSAARTIVHLHLFAYTAPAKQTVRSAVGNEITSGGRDGRVGSLDGATKVEVERRRVDASTTAGVWESHEGHDHDARSRKWVLRVRWAEEREERDEWLCDMPTGDTLFEWIRQIKAFAAIIKAETLDNGPMVPLISAVMTSPQTEGGESTRSPDASGGPMTSIPSTSSHLQTEDLATMLDKADLEWRLRRAEPLRHSDGNVSSTSLATRRLSPDGGTRVADRGASRSPSMRSSGENGTVKPSTTPPSGPPPNAPLPPAPLGADQAKTATGVPPQRLRAGSSSSSPAPSLPPPTIPLPSVPSGEPQGQHQEPKPTSSSVAYTPDHGSAAGGLTTKEDVYEFPIPPSTPSVPTYNGSTAALAESPVTVQLDGMRQWTIDRSDSGGSAFKQDDYLSPPPRFGPSAWVEDKDDTASISSKGSSARMRRLIRKQQPAMDLMAELSGRPEMNFERPPELQPDTTPIDEDRPRRIRFV